MSVYSGGMYLRGSRGAHTSCIPSEERGGQASPPRLASPGVKQIDMGESCMGGCQIDMPALASTLAGSQAPALVQPFMSMTGHLLLSSPMSASFDSIRIIWLTCRRE